MIEDLKRDIISGLSRYGQQGCYVNELFRNLRCSKNDFLKAKNQLIRQGAIRTQRQGKQRIRLLLDADYFTDMDKSFHGTMRHHELKANECLRRLQHLRPLFVNIQDRNSLSNVQVRHKDISKWLGDIITVIEEISQYSMIFLMRYHFDPRATKSDLRESQRLGFDTMQKIISRLIEQHKDEQDELCNYLLWGTVSSFSYVF
ncbi:MAG TPA: hypothetical protein VFA69_07310 [Candidatus Nitrosotalea sp.]|nr:hypothetical protein [Candidatus Nitrosotalea sp.]